MENKKKKQKKKKKKAVVEIHRYMQRMKLQSHHQIGQWVLYGKVPMKNVESYKKMKLPMMYVYLKMVIYVKI